MNQTGEQGSSREGSLPPWRWLDAMAWLPAVFLLSAVLAFLLTNPDRPFESPLLLLSLNFFTRTLPSLLIMMLIGQSFLVRREPGLLLVGCGVIIWGASGFLGSVVLQQEANFSTTVSQTGLLLSALCHLAGILLFLRSDHKVHASRAWLTAACAASLAAVWLLTHGIRAGWLPEFFAEGSGGTLPRQITLGAALAIFLSATLLLWLSNRRLKSGFVLWYAQGLLLIAISLLGLLGVTSRASLLNWTCRLAQYVAGLSLLFAAYRLVKEKQIPWKPAGIQESPFLGWLNGIPVAGMVLLIASLWPMRDHGSWGPYWILPVFNAIFATSVALVFTVLAARSVLAGGRQPVALLGGGMLAYAIASASGGICASNGWLPQGVIVFNLGVCLAGGLTLTGGLLLLLPEHWHKWVPARWVLAGSYILTAVFMGIALYGAFSGAIPPFFTSAGPTVLRKVVSASTTLAFAGASGALFILSRRESSNVFRLYSFGCMLLTLGFASVGVIRVVGNPLSWGATFAMYLGMAYLLVAAERAEQHVGDRSIALLLERTLRKARHRYSVAILVTFAAAALRLILMGPRESRAAFVTFYPAVMIAALYGGLGAGLLATFLTGILVAYFFMEPFYQFNISHTQDWVSMMIFLLSCTMVSWITEVMHRAKTQAARSEEVARQAVERAWVEQSLRASEERLRVVFQGMHEAFLIQEIIRDDEGRLIDLRYLEVNPAAEQQLSRTREQLIGHTRSEVLGPMDPEVHAFITRAISDDKPAYQERYAAGRWFEVLSYVPWPGYLATLNMDITARKEVDAALRRERDLLQRVMDGTLDTHLVYLDRDFNFVSVNNVYAKTCGCRPEDMIGKNHFELYPHAENEAIFTRVRDTGETYEVHDKPFSFPDQPERGTTYWDWSLTAVKDEDGRVEGLIFCLHETTERVRAEEALRVANESLELRVAERTRESRQLTDQLRALASELSQAEQRERKRLATILHDNLQQLLVAAKMQMQVVRNADIESRNAKVDKVEAILLEAITISRSLAVELSPPVLHQAGLGPALDWLAGRMEEQHLFSVRVETDPRAEPTAEPVRLLLFESVREILLNAIKHSKVSEACVIMEPAPEGGTRIIISDAGAGYDLDAVKARKTGGLGLFSIQQRLTYFGGQMEIVTAPGQGTRVVLMTPPEKSADRIHSRPALRPKRPGPAMEPRTGGQIRVLVVDDHPIVRQGLTSLLQMEPDLMIVGDAENGSEALEKAHRLHPDVVVTDVSLPGMDGVELTRVLQRELPGIKVLALSMHGDQAIVTAMREAGASGYLMKGGPTEDLIATLRACAEQTATEEGAASSSSDFLATLQ